jgi:tetratricopeptide (TPR) repeat protein/tRNA A-37 threonylcarbamoyl transferase component Bud32
MTTLPCPPELWPAFSALLDTALDLPETDRATWLAALGPEHEAVRPWLLKVLAGSERAVSTRFLERPLVRPEIVAEFEAGQRIGPYVLERELGRGGMGEVWLAARSDGNLSRRVALKLPYAYVMAGVLRRRFERERDILASLSHPHIAQLYDAGVSDNGHPYLAMEWIDGLPITRYCSDNELSLAQRLDLFRQVLEAVDYAHARLIAHRDIKPSNILVTRDGQVKLLDFGIAKLLAADTSSEATELTRLAGRAITPEYAAPEQIAGAALTTSVDVYALGVVLYELLAGRRPFDSLPKRGPATPMDAPLASSRITADHARTLAGSDPRALRRALSGDLDAILAKALEADPARRYRTVEAFAEDLDRSRRHEAISARRIGFVTQAGKFVRRHRLGVAASAALLLLLVGGSAGIAWQALRAEREAQRATAIKDFLIGMFRASDPRIASDKPRGTLTARQLLDIGSQRIEKDFASDPATEIQLLGITANIYTFLDDNTRSVELLHRQIKLAQAYYGDRHPIVIKGLLDEVDGTIIRGDYERALKLLDRAGGLIRRGDLERSALEARWLLQRGQALMSDFDARIERAQLFDRSAQLFAELAPTDRGYATALGERGNMYLEDNDYPAAARQYREAIAADEHINPRDDGELIQIYYGLALASQYQGDVAGTEGAYARATDLAQRTYGPKSHFYWEEAASYAQFVHLRGDRVRALQMFEALLRDLPGAHDGFQSATEQNGVALVLEKYGSCLAAEGQLDRAVSMLESAERDYQAAPVYDSDLPWVRLILGDAYLRAGHLGDARRLIETALDVFIRRGPQDDLSVLAARERWARLLLAEGNDGDAEKQLQAVLAYQNQKRWEVVAQAQGDLAQVAIRRHQGSTAVELSTKALAMEAQVHGPKDVRVYSQLLLVHAQALAAAGDTSAAAAAASRALAGFRRYNAPASPDIAQAQTLLRALADPDSASARLRLRSAAGAVRTEGRSDSDSGEGGSRDRGRSGIERS